MSYEFADEVTVGVAANPDTLFDYLDDQTKLAGHMSKPSVMMMGGSMGYEFDDASGKAIGSVITMRGRMLGVSLFVQEVVTEREPPRFKAWETRGRVHLLILRCYRMGFEIARASFGSRLRVFIQYDVPEGLLGSLVVGWLARMYARWCVSRMTSDARRAFGNSLPTNR